MSITGVQAARSFFDKGHVIRVSWSLLLPDRRFVARADPWHMPAGVCCRVLKSLSSLDRSADNLTSFLGQDGNS
jgi:hypothetical protein